MTSFSRADRFVPVLLIALSAIPVIGGSLRLFQLAGGADIMPESARFLAAPSGALVLHIISVSVFCVLGAFQFSNGFRRRRPGWHRTAGRILVPFGMIAALTGLWLSQFFPPGEHDGQLLYGIRLVVGSAMMLFIILGFAAIRRRDFPRHRAWMMRGYALGLSAGTQALIGIPWVLIHVAPGELSRALLLGAGWMINIAVVEWIIRRRPISSHPSDRASHVDAALFVAGSAGGSASSSATTRAFMDH